MKTLEEDKKTQLLKEKRDRDEMQQKFREAQKQKEFLESTLKEDHERFQMKLRSVMSELRLQEV